jgi:hypothetical protein
MPSELLVCSQNSEGFQLMPWTTKINDFGKKSA